MRTKKEKRLKNASILVRMHKPSKLKVKNDAAKAGLPVEVYVRRELDIESIEIVEDAKARLKNEKVRANVQE